MRNLHIKVGDVRLSQKAKDNVNEVLNSNSLSYGKFSRQFESEFARLHDSKFGVFTNSGTSSLQIAIQALKLKYHWQDGDEIIVPATTFVATSNTVLQNNLRPIFADVDPLTWTMEPESIEKVRNAKTRAIIPVHLLGQPCDMNAIESFGLPIIEDSAECFLSRYNGKKVGSFGEVGVFSTYVAHYIVTGVGGMCVTSDLELAVKLRSLANHGRDSIFFSVDAPTEAIIARRFHFTDIGHSYRATEMEAAIGMASLEHAEEIFNQRRVFAHRYMEGLSSLHDVIQLPTELNDREHSFMMFGIVLKNEPKKRIVNYLEGKGIETRDIPTLLYQPVYSIDPLQYQVSDWIARSGFYIGCHENLTFEQIDYVVHTIKEYFQK